MTQKSILLVLALLATNICAKLFSGSEALSPQADEGTAANLESTNLQPNDSLPILHDHAKILRAKVMGYPVRGAVAVPVATLPYAAPRCRHCKRKRRGQNKRSGKNSAPRIPNLKLHYFGVRFRGEPARLMLHYKKVPFVDNRIQMSDWPSLKSQYPNGQLPVLDVDGIPLSQSFAIYHYIGRICNMDGADELDTAKINSLGEEFRELQNKFTPYLKMIVASKGPTPKAVMDKELKTVVGPAIDMHCSRLEKALDNSASGFFGKNISWLDFVVADFTKTLRQSAQMYMNRFKGLQHHMSKVYGLPGVKEYVEQRKETPV